MDVIGKLTEELSEVTDKLHKLEVFISVQESAEEPIVTDYHLDLLRSQEYYMSEYAKTLRLRIADVKKYGGCQVAK